MNKKVFIISSIALILLGVTIIIVSILVSHKSTKIEEVPIEPERDIIIQDEPEDKPETVDISNKNNPITEEISKQHLAELESAPDAANGLDDFEWSLKEHVDGLYNETDDVRGNIVSSVVDASNPIEFNKEPQLFTSTDNSAIGSYYYKNDGIKHNVFYIITPADELYVYCYVLGD